MQLLWVPGMAEEGMGRLLLMVGCQGMHFSAHRLQQLTGKGMQ